jgi:hypothetical protein
VIALPAWAKQNHDDAVIEMKNTITSSSSPVDSNEFHIASSDAEIKINSIIRISEIDYDFTEYLLKNTGNKIKSNKFSQLVRKDLVTYLRNKEKKLVKNDCGGKYLEGEICGIDINPITCTQDNSEYPYYYKSVKVKDGYIIHYRWKEFDDIVASYHMVYLNKKWILSGLNCKEYLKYNINPSE